MLTNRDSKKQGASKFIQNKQSALQSKKIDANLIYEPIKSATPKTNK